MRKTWTVLLGLCLLLGATPALALVPLEGLLKGEVGEDTQSDPLSFVFQEPASSAPWQRVQHKRYQRLLEDAQRLESSCRVVGEARYGSPQAEVIARRSVVATLQYLGIDYTVKALGRYARELQMPQDEYTKLAENLVKSSCSPNLSVYGVKLVQQNLKAAWQSSEFPLPSLPGWPYSAEALVTKVNSVDAKEREFHHTIELFRAFCSWGGDTQNYRLLVPVLKHPVLMSWLYRHLQNQSWRWDEKQEALTLVEGSGAVQVNCQDYLCRRSTGGEFRERFPLTVGSTGLGTDLERLYCHHFKRQELSPKGLPPSVAGWVRALNPENEHWLTGQFQALVTGVADLTVALGKWPELKDDLRAGIDERWGRWAQQLIQRFSRDLLFEESLEIKVRPRRDPTLIRDRLFGVELAVTMGELDRIIQDDDKLSMKLHLKLSRNWLRWVRSSYTDAARTSSPEKREAFVAEVAARLRPLVEEKQKYFPTPLIKTGLEDILAAELIEQLLLYQGPLFDELTDKMLEVPVQLRYGMFALGYIRYKALLKSRATTLDL